MRSFFTCTDFTCADLIAHAPRCIAIAFIFTLTAISALPQTQAAVIAGVTISSVSSEFAPPTPTRNAVDTINGSGLTPMFPTTLGTATHSNATANDFWQSNFASDPEVVNGTGKIGHIVYDLGAVYNVSRFEVWNYSEGLGGAGGAEAGVQNVQIRVSETYNMTGLSNTLVGPMTTLTTNQFVKAPLGDINGQYPGTIYTEAFTARYVRLDTITRFSLGSNGAGFAEIRFEQAEVVPEPSTYALSLIGLVGLGIVALRKKYRRA